MKDVFDLLRKADPLEDEPRSLDDARDELRKRVVTTTVRARMPTSRDSRSRRAVMTMAGTLAIAVGVIGVLVDFNDRGTLQAAVRFEVRLAETRAVSGLIVSRVADSDRLIYLHPETIVTNDDVAHSWVTQDGPNQYGVSVALLEAGAQRMRQATAAHIGRPVAILIDGEVVTAPIVRSPIGQSAVISGDYTLAEAQRVADGIGVR